MQLRAFEAASNEKAIFEVSRSIGGVNLKSSVTGNNVRYEKSS